MGLGVVGMTVLGIVFTVKSGRPEWLFAGLPFSLVLFVTGRLAPMAYRFAGDGVHIERKAGDRVIPYRVIRAIDREDRPVNGITVFGSKGAFGRFGRFWNRPLGFYRLYLSNRESVVWLSTNNGWIGLSPDRPDEFVDRLRAHVGLVR